MTFAWFVDFDIRSPLVGFLIQSQIGMFSGLEKRSKPPASDRHRGVQPGSLRCIRIDDRRHKREVPDLDGEGAPFGTTESAYIRGVCTPIHHDLAGFRAERYPDIDSVVVPTIDHRRHPADFDSILPGIEIHKIVGRRPAL